MATCGFTVELTSTVSAARLFKAIVVESHEVSPVVMPEHVKSASIIEGDGGVGSIREIIYADAIPCGSLKERIDVLDQDNFTAELTLLEGTGGLEWGTAHIKVVPSPGGGCVYTNDAKFSGFWRHGESNPLSDVEYNAEEIEGAKQALIGVFKATEAHLIANPDY